MSHTHCTSRGWIRLIAWTACAASLASGAIGQDLCVGFGFDQMTVDKDAQSAGAARLSILRAASLPGDATAFERYYSDYLLPRLTNCAEFENFGAIRSQVSRELGMTTAAPVHDKLAEILLTGCQQILAGDYHRYSKLNAMLVIASLTGSPGQADDVYAPAAQSLIDVFVDDQAYLEVRIAAADGLVRHAATLTDEQKGAAVATVASVLSADEAPEGLDDTGYLWFRAATATLAGAVGDVGPDAAVLAGLRSMLDDEEVPPPLRCNAAKAIGGLDFSGAAEVSLVAVAGDLAQFCVDGYDREQERASELQLQSFNRPSVRMYLASVAIGLQGPAEDAGLVAAAAGGPDEAAIQGIVAIVQDWAAVMDDDPDVPLEQGKKSDIQRRYLQLKEAAERVNN